MQTHNGTSTTRVSSMKCCRGSNLQLQNTLPQCLSRGGGRLPANLWDRLLPQTEITLNPLQQPNATPNVSAYAHLSGPLDCNKMPLAPMGCAAQIHQKEDKRGTWQYHSVDGWYLYTSPDHYRTHAYHIKATKKE